jgi:hypothetical protein
MTTPGDQTTQVREDPKDNRDLRIKGYLRNNGTQIGIIGVFIALYAFFILAAP